MTKDKMLAVGNVSTVSDERDNIHWFIAQTEPIFMFNIGVYALNPNAATTARDYIALRQGENLSGGSVRVPRLGGGAAYKIYGKS